MKYLTLKIEVKNEFIGKEIRIISNNNLLCGIKIENPEGKKVIYYRNIPVKKNDYEIITKVKYELEEHKVAILSKEQVSYNQRLGIQRKFGINHALSGNVNSPKKIIVTFSGLNFTTSDIQYPVATLNSIVASNPIFNDVVVIAFQDSYNLTGSMLYIDDKGNKIKNNVRAVIDHYKEIFDVDDEETLFFGASKGGAMALCFAHSYKKSKLLLSATPLLFKEYVRKNQHLRNIYLPILNDAGYIEPLRYLEKYIEENREMTFLYSIDDSNTNQNIIENLSSSNVVKYLFKKPHSKVTWDNITLLSNLMYKKLYSPKNKYSTASLSDFSNKKIEFTLPILEEKIVNCFLVIKNNGEEVNIPIRLEKRLCTVIASAQEYLFDFISYYMKMDSTMFCKCITATSTYEMNIESNIDYYNKIEKMKKDRIYSYFTNNKVYDLGLKCRLNKNNETVDVVFGNVDSPLINYENSIVFETLDSGLDTIEFPNRVEAIIREINKLKSIYEFKNTNIFVSKEFYIAVHFILPLTTLNKYRLYIQKGYLLSNEETISEKNLKMYTNKVILEHKMNLINSKCLEKTNI